MLFRTSGPWEVESVHGDIARFGRPDLGLRQTTPAMLMGAPRRRGRPIMFTGGPMLRGKWRQEELGSGTEILAAVGSSWRGCGGVIVGVFFCFTDEELCEVGCSLCAVAFRTSPLHAV